jgi:hypothetical protein
MTIFIAKFRPDPSVNDLGRTDLGFSRDIESAYQFDTENEAVSSGLLTLANVRATIDGREYRCGRIKVAKAGDKFVLSCDTIG